MALPKTKNYLVSELIYWGVLGRNIEFENTNFCRNFSDVIVSKVVMKRFEPLEEFPDTVFKVFVYHWHLSESPAVLNEPLRMHKEFMKKRTRAHNNGQGWKIEMKGEW